MVRPPYTTSDVIEVHACLSQALIQLARMVGVITSGPYCGPVPICSRENRPGGSMAIVSLVETEPGLFEGSSKAITQGVYHASFVVSWSVPPVPGHGVPLEDRIRSIMMSLTVEDADLWWERFGPGSEALKHTVRLLPSISHNAYYVRKLVAAACTQSIFSVAQLDPRPRSILEPQRLERRLTHPVRGESCMASLSYAPVNSLDSLA